MGNGRERNDDSLGHALSRSGVPRTYLGAWRRRTVNTVV